MYIPAELIEQILLKLPIKSLIRFSTVSKSWNSMIFGQEFAKTYRGREMLVMERHVYPLSSISLFADRSTPFPRPFKLWCVEFENSLILHNPTTRKYRKLPIPSARAPIGSTAFVYGLGYDSVGDDYKILKIHTTLDVPTELYNWEFSYDGRCVFAGGALHWPIRCNPQNNGKGLKGPAVLSFDLSTHKFKGLKPIKKTSTPNTDSPKKMKDMGFGCVGSGTFSTRVEGADIVVNSRHADIYVESFVSPYPTITQTLDLPLPYVLCC